MKQGKGVGINDLVSGIFYSFEEGLYLFSTETLDLFVNIRFCEMFGETCDLQFEVNRLILLPNQVADRIIINHRDLLVTVGDDEIFREVRKADGNTVSLFIKRSVYKNNGNTFYLGVVRDVSDYLSLEKSREEATRIFHHDVRNYIGNIQNLLELLGEQVDKEHDELVRIVQSTGDKLLKIIETFIENYRLEERSFIIERSRTNILQTIEELIVRFSPVARHKDIVFEVNPERKDLDYWFLFCDSLLV
ncbi:MAG: sensor histidine kinase, partial [bacterium]